MKSVRSVFIVSVLLVVSAAVIPADTPVLGVPGIQGVDVEESVVQAVRSIVESAFLKTGKYKVLAYNDMEEILNAQKLSLSGAFDDETAAEIGKIVSAQSIIHGEIVGFGGPMLLSLRMIDVETGQAEKSEIKKIPDMDSLEQEIHELVFSMVDMVYHPDAQADRNIAALTIEDLRNSMMEIVPEDAPEKSFTISRYEITQGQWEDLGWTNPSHFRDELFPVESVSFDKVIMFCNRLSIREGLEPVYSRDEKGRLNWDEWKNGYRLPTLEEWSYAVYSGGTRGAEDYAGSRYPDLVAWYKDNSTSQTHTVGQKAPNTAGLYDMCGNVREMCWAEGFTLDDDMEYWYFNNIPTRGGSYLDSAGWCKAHVIGKKFTRLTTGQYGTGFRLVRSGERMLEAALEKHQRDQAMIQEAERAFDDMIDRWDLVNVVRSGDSVSFTMGKPGNKNNIDSPKHTVVWNQPFSISRYEMTVGDFISCIRYAQLKGLVTVVSNSDNEVMAVAFKHRNGYPYLMAYEDNSYRSPFNFFKIDPETGLILYHTGYDSDLNNVMPLYYRTGLHLCNVISELDDRDPCYEYVFKGDGWKAPVLNPEADGYRYPFEAEWELAAMGGSEKKKYRYAGSNNFNDVTRTAEGDYGVSFFQHWQWQPGLFKPNSLGIHDMSGTLGEHTNDLFYPYSDEELINPVAWIYMDAEGGPVQFENYNQQVEKPHPYNYGLKKGDVASYTQELPNEKKYRQITSRGARNSYEWGSLRVTTRTLP